MNPYLAATHKRGRKRARIEIIPLIDIMILLLCFAMFTMMHMVIQRGVFVDLAESDTSKPLDRASEVITLSVNAEGEVFINKEKTSEPELEKFLKSLSANPSHPSVVINADKEARHGRVIHLLDLARKCGIEEAVFSVKPTE